MQRLPLSGARGSLSGLGTALFGSLLITIAAGEIHQNGFPGGAGTWIVAALFLSVGIFAGFEGIRTIARGISADGGTIYVFERGLVQVKNRGADVFAWRDLDVRYRRVEYRKAHTTGGTPFATEHEYTLTRTDGAKLYLDRKLSEQVVAFGPKIVESITLARLPGVVAKVDAGNVVSFGAVRITLDGIRFSPTSPVIPWSRVVQAAVGPAEWLVQVRHPSKPDKVTHSSGRTDQTPNAPLMAALCNALSARGHPPEG